MKKNLRKSFKKRNIIICVLCVLLCIGTAELIACRVFDPDLYQQITAPVRQAFSTLGEWGQGALQAAEEFLATAATPIPTPAPASQPPEESWEPQLAQDPSLEYDFPLVDPAVTELVTEDGQQVLVGNGLRTVYYLQNDSRWTNLPYGTDNIGGYGCGPTAMAMVVSSMTDQTIDPPAMAQWAYEHGYWASQSGTYHSFIPEGGKAFGLTVESFSQRDPQALRDALLSGHLFIALMGPGHFTDGGHFIVLRGVTLSGDILVADPNSSERSLMAWDPQIIFEELAHNAAHGGPLWLLSRPVTPQS